MCIRDRYIIRDEEALRDGIDVKPEDLYAYTKKTGKLCGMETMKMRFHISDGDGKIVIRPKKTEFIRVICINSFMT